MGLAKLAQEDPSFNFSRDEETGQTVIEGMGELHLEVGVWCACGAALGSHAHMTRTRCCAATPAAANALPGASTSAPSLPNPIPNPC